jgi:fructokinase
VTVEAPPGKVVDTIGAGDSFQAALLFALQATGRLEARSLSRISAEELRRSLSFAASCAGFTCGRAGADPPRRTDVEDQLSELLAGRGDQTAGAT